MIKRSNYFDVMAYLDYHEKIMQSSSKTIKRKWGHLRHLLNWADGVLFPNARRIAPTYPAYLLTARNDGKDKQLSPASMQRACLEARSFFEWAKINKPVRYKKIPQSWIDSIRISREHRPQSILEDREYYSLSEVRKLIDFIPERLIDKRDRASTAFVFLSGVRVSVLVSIPLKCIDVRDRTVSQLPSEGVRTKNSKAARTYMLPIDDLLAVVSEWHEIVSNGLGEDALWYPGLTTDGMKWNLAKNQGTIEAKRMSFSRGLKRICKQVGIEYKSPHKLRNGHGVFGVKAAKTIEDFKAFSQNMMHESMEITDRLYGRLAGDNVKMKISTMSIQSDQNGTDEELFNQFMAFQKWLKSQE